MTPIHSYNDAQGFLSSPSAFSEAYFRGANIWRDAAETIPRDSQKFFLAPGVAENWSTLAANIAQIPAGVRIGFRIIAFRSVPVGWKSRTIRKNDYPDWYDAPTRTKYENMLWAFKKKFPRINWLDIPFVWAPSDEPSITEADCKELGGGNLALGQSMYFTAAKWMIDLYAEVFGRALVGNLISPSWIRNELLPYQKAKGVRAFRQDSYMRFNWGGFGVDGENRGTSYDDCISLLGGRDGFDRLILEQTGNGLTLRNGIVDQGSGLPCTVWPQMMGPGGEFEKLEATDYANMGLKTPAPVSAHPNAAARLAAWYAYVGAPSVPAPLPGPVEPPPGDGGTPDPTPAPYQFPVKVLGGELIKVVFGGPYPDIIYDFGTTETVIPIPVVNGKRWNPRVHIFGEPELSQKWTIDPAEPSGEDQALSFHCAGRDSAVVTFEGFEGYEPIPDPTPEPPAPVDYVTREAFELFRSELVKTLELVMADVGVLEAKAAILEADKADKVHGHEANVRLT